MFAVCAPHVRFFSAPRQSLCDQVRLSFCLCGGKVISRFHWNSVLLLHGPRKNWLTFGGDAVLDTDHGSLFHFAHHCRIGDFMTFISTSHTVTGWFSQHSTRYVVNPQHLRAIKQTSGSESGLILKSGFKSWIIFGWDYGLGGGIGPYAVWVQNRPNHSIKFQWNRLITFAVILLTDRMNESQTNRRLLVLTQYTNVTNTQIDTQTDTARYICHQGRKWSKEGRKKGSFITDP